MDVFEEPESVSSAFKFVVTAQQTEIPSVIANAKRCLILLNMSFLLRKIVWQICRFWCRMARHYPVTFSDTFSVSVHLCTEESRGASGFNPTGKAIKWQRNKIIPTFRKCPAADF